MDDKNWGCAYRSLQTLASWLLWQGIVSPLRELPSIRCIQETLVRVGDKKANFIGSRQWIGSLEVCHALLELLTVSLDLLFLLEHFTLWFYGLLFWQSLLSLTAIYRNGVLLF